MSESSRGGRHRKREEPRLAGVFNFASRVLAGATSKLLADMIRKGWEWMNS
ncbi:hypothetical protein CCYS_11145 [Corynebacterium cystitidis DSM 20524]|uniref:Uncharacterized protein n=1 Tax=Corynebacterium cystitidis DSM 20524 TaxID=1121357 RepID=A0A1H9SP57_9CORY|nr:hypothetical protein CCYS_11145 [Corynebacterium cystitidis DSM 20524]SER86790.1 hypothetical protein SAMN05661109_01207 [Corynebacterium cystitidis DSM 20524]SNV66517.1 Uncharacterised protein [Corynebacterium cystitidis]